MRIVIIISDSRQLFGLRKELVASWVNAGHEVIAMGDGTEADFKAQCAEAGFGYRHVTLSRNGINPLTDYKTLKELTAALKELQPDRVFCTFAKAVSYGCWAARRAGITHTYALISGLGSIFRGNSFKQRCVRVVMSILYKHAFRYCDTVVFQNKDDLNELVRRKLLRHDHACVVNGSGVDLTKFVNQPLPTDNTFVFVGRLLKEKGIREYVEAARIVKKCYPDTRFIAIGDTDTNPSSLSQTQVDAYAKEGLIEFYGFQSDVRPFIKQARFFVLPSYHEGTPRCVLEAMAMGRPIITSDAPGCRETVIDGINGYLVPVGDSTTLAAKMKELIEKPDVAEKMGQKSHEIAVERYDVNKVNAKYATIMKL